MNYDENLAARVRRILGRRKDVVEKQMVGGRSFMVGGKMCCGVVAGDLMIRVGSDGLPRALAEPHVKPMKFAGRPLSGFVLVEPAGYRTAAVLASWVQRGVDFVATLPTARKSAPAIRRTPPRGSRRQPRTRGDARPPRPAPRGRAS